MAVFRVEKTKDFTLMSNHHLKNRKLTLKAKGLLSLMLSLPDSWDYTLKGLASICSEGIDAVRTAVKELEQDVYKRQVPCSKPMQTMTFRSFGDNSSRIVMPVDRKMEKTF